MASKGVSNYVLYYWKTRARAEPIRLMFAYANVPYVNRTIDKKTEWPTMKPTMPFKQVPVLEVDGKHRIAQTKAICRFLARRFDLNGKCEYEEAMMDMYGDGVEDGIVAIRPWVQILVGNSTENKDKCFESVVVPYIANNIGPLYERFLCDNGDEWLVGNSVKWIDFYVAEYFDKFTSFGSPNALDKLPLIKAHIQRVFKLPHVKEYINARPVYNY